MTDTALAKTGCCTPAPLAQESSETLQNIPRLTRMPNHGLIALASGTFAMGADNGPHPEDGEGPVRQVTLNAYSLAPLTVTDALFADVVDAKGYNTLAE